MTTRRLNEAEVAKFKDGVDAIIKSRSLGIVQRAINRNGYYKPRRGQTIELARLKRLLNLMTNDEGDV